MAGTLDRIDIPPGDPPDSAAAKPKLRLSFLRQAWNDWCQGFPCVQEFYGKLAAEAAEAQAPSPDGAASEPAAPQ